MKNDLLKIGLSLPCKSVRQLTEIQDLPENFELLELSGEIAGEAHLLKQGNDLLGEFDFFNFRNIISPALTSQLTSENLPIVTEYKRQLRSLFASAAKCSAEAVGIDPDWESLIHDEDRHNIFNNILQATAGDRDFYNLDLLIAVRLPGTGAVPVTESVKLLHKLSNHRVKLALDINPHELLKSDIDWENLLKQFRFETSCIRFCYPSELGNKLLYKHIEPVVNVVRKWQREIALYIAPSGKADLEELSTMVQEINQAESGI